MDIDNTVLLSYSEGMALLRPNWEAYEILYGRANFNHITILYKFPKRLIRPLLN